MTRFEQLYGIPLAKRRRTEILIALMALEIIFAFSYLGFIIIPPISITTMHLLVMIAAMILGTRESVAVSLVFALTSMWQAGVSGVQYSDLIFSPIQSGEPLNSLLLNSARLIGGFAAGELFKLVLCPKAEACVSLHCADDAGGYMDFWHADLSVHGVAVPPNRCDGFHGADGMDRAKQSGGLCADGAGDDAGAFCAVAKRSETVHDGGRRIGGTL